MNANFLKKLNLMSNEKQDLKIEEPTSDQFRDESLILADTPAIHSPKKFVLRPLTSRREVKLKPEKVEECNPVAINALPKPKNRIRIRTTKNKLSKKVTACKTISEEEKEEERANNFNKLLGLGGRRRKKKKEDRLQMVGMGNRGYIKMTTLDLDIKGMEKKMQDNAKNLLGKVFKGVK